MWRTANRERKAFENALIGSSKMKRCKQSLKKLQMLDEAMVRVALHTCVKRVIGGKRHRACRLPGMSDRSTRNASSINETTKKRASDPFGIDRFLA